MPTSRPCWKPCTPSAATSSPPTRSRSTAKPAFPTEAFAALKAQKYLSCYVPAEYGGMGLNVTDVTRMCEVLGQYCASTAMVFAMHQIQVACIVNHALGSPFFQAYAREMVAQQPLIASATTRNWASAATCARACAPCRWKATASRSRSRPR